MNCKSDECIFLLKLDKLVRMQEDEFTCHFNMENPCLNPVCMNLNYNTRDFMISRGI